MSSYNGASVAITVLIFALLFNIILASLAPFIFSLRERMAFFHVPQQPQQPQPKEEYNHYQEGSHTYTYPTGTTQSQVRTQYPQT
jgi:hypothetical protein